ncbi:MAG: HI0074 family nucleotidyltransferase substrate-binding subunit [Campylobacterota bacterium]|nr:HI0074 family nucleotidyltransferase substrate-binding subunit [Campylobacterota bacterium]
MKIDTTYLKRCVLALDKAYHTLEKYSVEDIEYDIYRSATIKEFEIILEQSGKLLKKAFKPYFHTPKAADSLYFKDIFREAGLHGLLSVEEVERWLKYRDNRNSTSHDYGADLANETLVLMEQFIVDATKLSEVIESSDAS